jgi:hypothetical protein
VKEKGLSGLNETEEKKEEETEEKKEPTLPRPPGLEEPFPGEHPFAGVGEGSDPSRRTGESKSVSGTKIRGFSSGLDAAVDEVFLNNKRIDMEQLEKDWIAFSKRG